MEEERGEKRLMRELWVQEAQEYINNHPTDEGTIYLTLSGAQGRDIRLFVDHGVLRLTESGSVATEEQGKVVAVESNPQAVLELQRRFPGLKIINKDVQSLLGGLEPFSWPSSDDKPHCRARVVNLDLNGGLKAEKVQGQIRFPVVTWIEKLARLHARAPRRDWTLCLTLHGELHWDSETCNFVQQFLCDNFEREPRFAESCRSLFGTDTYDSIDSDNSVNFSTLSSDTQQQVLMVVVPKLITQHVQNQGWRVHTEHNLRYGGGEHARMVTWVVRFTWDADTLAAPDAAHRQALTGIFHSVGSIRKDGQIEEDG
jgi:hypothetical protein